MDHRTSRDAGRVARWLLISGLGVFGLLVAWVAMTWATQGSETAGMELIVFGMPPLLVGCGLLLLGAVLGAWPLLLAREASVLDRLLWLSGAGVTLTLVSLYATSRPSSGPTLDAVDRQRVLEVSLRALEAGRLDTNQMAGDPVFPTWPVLLRTAPPLRDPRVSQDWLDQMVARGLLAGSCDAPILNECARDGGSTFVSVVDASRVTDYVSVQLDVMRLDEGRCGSAADSAVTSTFRLRVVPAERGWEVSRVVTVGWGWKRCWM